MRRPSGLHLRARLPMLEHARKCVCVSGLHDGNVLLEAKKERPCPRLGSRPRALSEKGARAGPQRRRRPAVPNGSW
eukprot:3326108-Alexandrium_andersonii.AAC.1